MNRYFATAEYGFQGCFVKNGSIGTLSVRKIPFRVLSSNSWQFAKDRRKVC